MLSQQLDHWPHYVPCVPLHRIRSGMLHRSAIFPKVFSLSSQNLVSQFIFRTPQLYAAWNFHSGSGCRTPTLESLALPLNQENKRQDVQGHQIQDQDRIRTHRVLQVNNLSFWDFQYTDSSYLDLQGCFASFFPINTQRSYSIFVSDHGSKLLKNIKLTAYCWFVSLKHSISRSLIEVATAIERWLLSKLKRLLTTVYSIWFTICF